MYTTYLAKVKELPEGVTPVSIARWMPPGVKMVQISKLVPPQDLIKGRKSGNISVEEFKARYKDEVLAKTTVGEVLSEIQTKAGSLKVALVCFEKSEYAKGYDVEKDFCHRDIVRGWLQDAGVEITEFK